MKKFLCILLIVLALCSVFSGCNNETRDSNKITIVATVFPPFDFAREIVGDKAEVTMLIRPGSESHGFEPTPMDVKKAEECDIFIMLGGESENWAVRLAENSKNSERIVLTLNSTVNLLCTHEEENSHEHDEEYDEHIWTSPLNAIKMSKAICDALCRKDPENADYYKGNFENYKEKLINLDSEFKKVSENKNNKTIVFGDRFPFRYLFSEYSLSYRAAFPGCAEQTEPDINTVVGLIELIKYENITTVFYTEFSNGKTADMLCKETGAKKELLHSCHNITKAEWDSKETYISLMSRNLEAIKKAVQ